MRSRGSSRNSKIESVKDSSYLNVSAWNLSKSSDYGSNKRHSSLKERGPLSKQGSLRMKRGSGRKKRRESCRGSHLSSRRRSSRGRCRKASRHRRRWGWNKRDSRQAWERRRDEGRTWQQLKLLRRSDSRLWLKKSLGKMLLMKGDALKSYRGKKLQLKAWDNKRSRGRELKRQERRRMKSDWEK